MKPEITDTDRLNWLIEHGYTPAKWRERKHFEPVNRTGMVFAGLGGREEIDAAMAKNSPAANRTLQSDILDDIKKPIECGVPEYLNQRLKFWDEITSEKPIKIQ